MREHFALSPAGFLITKEKPMHCKDPARQLRSLRCCHLPAEEQPIHAPPRDSAAYVPEMAARIDDDRNLTDGARRCARKLAEYTYRKNRDGRAAEITVTWLMKALGRSRRTVQRYLRQLERAGYIAVEVIQTRTRMCAGLLIEMMAPCFPRHHRAKWPQKLIEPDASRKSQKDRFRYRYSRKLWAIRCMDGAFRALTETLPLLPALPGGNNVLSALVFSEVLLGEDDRSSCRASK
jgi:DNA-binding transcriptional ArsR family regulator